MANIKGITIDIGGNTSKLEEALKHVNKTVYTTNGNLRELNHALKLDPKNTEALSTKQKVLAENIKATTKRLETLKEAQKQMGDYNSLTDEQKEKYKNLSIEIAKSEANLKRMNDEMKKTGGHDFSKLKDGLSKVGDVALSVSKKLAQTTVAISGALAGVVGAGVKSYAELEQNIGGVETLFKDSAEKVVENAKQAYKTAGVSANEYMQGVTSFSASLLQSLGGDTSKAADIADMAFRDMSDNANKFGTDMASIQNAYQGFAKQNYTMLDNLKLGYGGTKTEMERLLADAEKISGVHYDISNLSDVYNAIHTIQEELGVTGTTAQEAEKTISGSVNSMKASFDNFLNGSGSAKDLSETVTNVLSNVGDAIVKLAPDILSGIVTLIEKLIPQVANLLIDLAPKLLDAVSNMIDSLLTLLTENTDSLQKTITMLINKVVEFITTNLPKIIQAGLTLLVALAKGIADSLPTMIPTIIECIITIVQTLLDNLPQIIEAGIQLLIGLIKGIVDAIPMLIDILPTIIETIVEVLIENLPLISEAAIEIMIALINGLIVSLPKLVAMVPKITMAIISGLIKALPQYLERGGEVIATLIKGISSMIGTLRSTIGKVVSTVINGIKNLPNKMKEWGKDAIKGFIDGIKAMIGKIGDAAKSVAGKIKNFLHFSKPDIGPLRDYETWMPDMVKGMAKGINKSSYLLENATDKMAQKMANRLSFRDIMKNTTSAMKTLNFGVNNSSNPLVNPSADSRIDRINSSDVGEKNIINNFTFNAQTLDDTQINKVVKAVNKTLGNAY